LNIAVRDFAMSSRLFVVFRYTARQILGPLRDIPGMITSVISNFIRREKYDNAG
jgi:hypothetical protein